MQAIQSLKTVSAGRDLPLPEGMTIPAKPTDFMAYPNETHYAEITDNTTPLRHPQESMCSCPTRNSRDLLFSEGWFIVEVRE